MSSHKGLRYKHPSDVYEVMPVVRCKGLCQHSCRDTALHPAEVEMFIELDLALPEDEDRPDGTRRCSHLTEEGRCGIYEHRPFVCRIWGGVHPDLPCEHGCEVEPKALSMKRLVRLYAKLDRMASDDVDFHYSDPRVRDLSDEERLEAARLFFERQRNLGIID